MTRCLADFSNNVKKWKERERDSEITRRRDRIKLKKITHLFVMPKSKDRTYIMEWSYFTWT